MGQSLENVLKYHRIAGWRSGLVRLRMLFGAVPAAHSKEKVNEVDCDQESKTRDVDMKEKLGGWWW